MSSILPQSRVARVTFYENHTADWSANATAIGTTTTAVTSLTTLTAAARAAYNAQQLAFDQSKAATQNFHDAVTAMDGAGTDIIKAIKAKAAVGGNAIYTLALLPVPATPSPIAAPGTPSNFTVALDQAGVLTLDWKCANPAGASGTVYQVARKLGGPDAAGGYAVVGTSGAKRFVDLTLPVGGGAGSGLVTYQVTAIRSTIAGAPAVFTVQFGTASSSGGSSTASVMSAPKLAA